MSILWKGTATIHRNLTNTIRINVHITARASYFEHFTFECPIIFGIKSAYTALVDSYAYVSMCERHYTIVSGEHAEETTLCRAYTFLRTISARSPRTKLVNYGDCSFDVIGH